jgi:hypothetical protein
MFVPFVGLVTGALIAFRLMRNARERIVYQDTRGQLDLLRLAE